MCVACARPRAVDRGAGAAGTTGSCSIYNRELFMITYKLNCRKAEEYEPTFLVPSVYSNPYTTQEVKIRDLAQRSS